MVDFAQIGNASAQDCMAREHINGSSAWRSHKRSRTVEEVATEVVIGVIIGIPTASAAALIYVATGIENALGFMDGGRHNGMPACNSPQLYGIAEGLAERLSEIRAVIAADAAAL